MFCILKILREDVCHVVLSTIKKHPQIFSSWFTTDNIICNLGVIFLKCRLRDIRVNIHTIFFRENIGLYFNLNPYYLKLIMQGSIRLTCLLKSNKIFTKICRIQSILVIWVPDSRFTTNEKDKYLMWPPCHHIFHMDSTKKKLTPTPFPIGSGAFSGISSSNSS